MSSNIQSLDYNKGFISISIPTGNQEGIRLYKDRFLYAAYINPRTTVMDEKENSPKYFYPRIIITPISPISWRYLYSITLKIDYCPGASVEILNELEKCNINILFCQYKKERIYLILDIYKSNLEDRYKKDKSELKKVLEKITKHEIIEHDDMKIYENFFNEYEGNGKIETPLLIEKDSVVKFLIDSLIITKIEQTLNEIDPGRDKLLHYHPFGREVIIFTDHFNRYILIHFIHPSYEIREFRIWHDDSPGKLRKIAEKLKVANTNILYAASFLTRFKEIAELRGIFEVRKNNGNKLKKELKMLMPSGIIYDFQEVPREKKIIKEIQIHEEINKLPPKRRNYSVRVILYKEKEPEIIITSIKKNKETKIELRKNLEKVFLILAKEKKWINNAELYAKSRGIKIRNVNKNDLRNLRNDISLIRKELKEKFKEDKKVGNLIEATKGFTRISTDQNKIVINTNAR